MNNALDANSPDELNGQAQAKPSKLVILRTCGQLGCYHLFDLSGKQLTACLTSPSPALACERVCRDNGWTLCL